MSIIVYKSVSIHFMLKVSMVISSMDLTELMSSNENIRLAYRNIKRNTGSKTAGTDKLTIKDIAHLSVEDVIAKVQAMFKWYEPQPVRRVFIPKGNGKTKTSRDTNYLG